MTKQPSFLAAVLALLALSWTSTSVAADSALTSAQVKHWLEHRIALAQMQNDMRRNAHQYKDLPLAYARKETQYLTAQGYSVKQFRAEETRIHNAANAIALAQQQADAQGTAGESRSDCEARVTQDIRDASIAPSELEKELAQMRALGLPEAQIEQIRQAQMQVHGNAASTARQTCALQAEAASTLAAHEQAMIESSRRDWPGVEPWLDALEHFSQWYAGNDSHPAPPTLD